MQSFNINVDDILEQEAIKILDEVTEDFYAKTVDASEKVIQDFYGAYSPMVYDRMHSFDNVCSPYKEKRGKLKRRVGMKVLEGVAGGHKDPDEYVFNGVMNLGYHGTSQIATSTPPMQLIDEFFASL